MVENIVLAYSGGLDTSVMTHWLKATHDADVTCVLVDMGQAGQALKEARARALENGAKACVMLDRVDTFADEHVAPAIQANALYQDAYPLATALGRPLIAKALVEVAHDVGADAIAHGCTGKGNDQVRIEASVNALDPSLEVLAPQRTDAMTRDEARAYASEHALSLPEVEEGSLFSVDTNLWGRSIEGGPLEDPAAPVVEEACAWTVSPQQAPEGPLSVEVTFQHGLPVALNGDEMPLASIVEALNTAMGQHGIGRIDHVEDRLVGIKSREVYEAPAAATILTAKKALEALTLTREEQKQKNLIEDAFAELVYEGRWFEPALDALLAFTTTVQANVSGTVTLEAYKGNLTVTQRDGDASLYDEALATYGHEDAFDHEASTGFIGIFQQPLQVVAKARGTAPPGGSS